MPRKKLLLLGGGGHCRSIIDSLISLNEYDDIGVVDNDPTIDFPNGISVVGTDDDLGFLYEQGWKSAFVSVGSVGNTALRRKLYDIINKYEFNIPIIVDPSAVIAKDAVIDKGVFVGKGAIINAKSFIDFAAIINTGAIIEHDCHVGEFAHISPGTVLCGNVKVGTDAHIGANSTVIQGTIIGEGSVIGIGSVVTKRVPDGTVAYGNPCKVVKKK